MNAYFVFDVCFDAYRQAWEDVYSGGMRAVDAGDFKGTSWKPDKKPRLQDFLADFAMAGRAALAGEMRSRRLILFELYHVGGAGWKATVRHLGVSEFIAAQWLDEIRSAVGQELIDRQVYPVRKYFQQPTGMADILWDEAT